MIKKKKRKELPKYLPRGVINVHTFDTSIPTVFPLNFQALSAASDRLLPESRKLSPGNVVHTHLTSSLVFVGSQSLSSLHPDPSFRPHYSGSRNFPRKITAKISLSERLLVICYGIMNLSGDKLAKRRRNKGGQHGRKKERRKGSKKPDEMGEFMVRVEGFRPQELVMYVFWCT